MDICRVENSAIKGYHIFKTRPHPSIPLAVQKEDGNSYDPNAMIVVMPKLEDIDSSLHDELFRERKGKEPQQTVTTNAGKTIGRVPANLCKLFRKVLDEGKVKRIHCLAQARPELSSRPRPLDKYQRNKGTIDNRGGGGVIPCQYLLYCKERNVSEVFEETKKTLRSLSHQGTETVKLDVCQPSSCPF